MNNIKSVLWLHDEPEKITNFLKLFKQKGINCDLAINSSEALKLLEKNKYSIIISNMSNVDASGYQLIAGLLFLQKVKEDLDIHTPFVIYCSYEEMKENKEVAMELGAKSITFQEDKLMNILGLNGK